MDQKYVNLLVEFKVNIQGIYKCNMQISGIP